MAQFIDSYGIALAVCRKYIGSIYIVLPKGMDCKSQVQGNSTPKGELNIYCLA
jgi:hypothetical protein